MQHSGERETFIQNICHELEVHAAIKEALFYPALRNPDFGPSRDVGNRESGRRPTLSQSLEQHFTIHERS